MPVSQNNSVYGIVHQVYVKVIFINVVSFKTLIVIKIFTAKVVSWTMTNAKLMEVVQQVQKVLVIFWIAHIQKHKDVKILTAESLAQARMKQHVQSQMDKENCVLLMIINNVAKLNFFLHLVVIIPILKTNVLVGALIIQLLSSVCKPHVLI